MGEWDDIANNVADQIESRKQQAEQSKNDNKLIAAGDVKAKTEIPV